jgi:hypothetical protein
MFEAVSQTLLSLAADPKRLGARIGFIAVLHTWGQALEHHPHVHCLIPGGGIALDGTRWAACKNNYFLPVAVMRELYRGKFMALLANAFAKGDLHFDGQLESLRDELAFAHLLKPLWKKKWVVYAKPPFGGPKQVLRYLARYTHRVAISNQRIVNIDDSGVTFHWKDYRDGQDKLMTLSGHEFLRRFLLHVVPSGFVKIRHYGLLSNRSRKEALPKARALLNVSTPVLAKADTVTADTTIATAEVKNPVCPKCGGPLSSTILLPVGRRPRVLPTGPPTPSSTDTS